MLLENILDRVNSLEQRLKQLTPTNQSFANSYDVIQPVKSLIHSTTENGNSLSARGMFLIEFFKTFSAVYLNLC